MLTIFKNIFREETNKNISFENFPDRIFIYSSELDYISRCILDYPHIETGGNLFGHYTKNGIPIVEYVLGPGMSAIHEKTKFQQEEKYLKNVYSRISDAFALSEIGVWHSHHQLDLPHPSGGDVKTVLNGLKKSGLNEFIVVIGSFTPPQTPVNAFTFIDNPMRPYQSLKWTILNGTSPFRKIIDQMCEGVLSHPKTLKGNYSDKLYYSFEKQHWLSDKNNVEELKVILKYIKQKTGDVKVFHPENDDIVIVIRLLDQNVRIIFPSIFPLDPSYLIKTINNKDELIDEVKDSIDISIGISQSVIQTLKDKKIL